nr:hypothetical protein [uncultured bacterium]
MNYRLCPKSYFKLRLFRQFILLPEKLLQTPGAGLMGSTPKCSST